MFKISDWFKLILCTVLSSGVATAGNFGQMNFAYWQKINTGPTATYLVVAGGGGGGPAGGGGGAGGLLTGTTSLVLGTTYTVTVGTGGSGGVGGSTLSNGSNGGNSIISGTGLTTITSIGGGGGGGAYDTSVPSGGSGGGASANGSVQTGGSGTSGQGNAGGSNGGVSGIPFPGGGGGGAGAVGSNGSSGGGGNGGAGLSNSITGSAVTYAGGGGGSTYTSAYSGGTGGAGGGGNGSAGGTGTAGTNGLGGGGGGSAYPNSGPTGGSGVVIISLPTGFVATTTGTPTITYNGTNTVYTFTGSGTITPVAWSYGISNQGLVAYLSAGISASYSGSGSTWTDLSTYGNNFTLYGSPTYSSGSGGYFTFDPASNQYGVISSFSGLGTSPSYTMCAWTYVTSLPLPNGADRPVIWYGSSGSNAVASFDFKGTGTSFYYTDLHYADDKVFTNYTPSSGAWFYGVITYDATTKNATLYINNVSQQTLTHSGTLNISSSIMGIAGDGISSSTRLWAGQIGEIQIYNRVLTTTEISQNWTATKTRYGY